MNYERVIPRDLFNEASLLKCYGQIYINLEKIGRVDVALIEDEESMREGFRVAMNMDSGGITVANVVLVVRGERCDLERPLNSRQPWPLYLTKPDGDVIEVFDANGAFSDEMRTFLTR